MSLLFALAALAGLSLAGVAMMRTADTSALVAGNIGFHGGAVQAADLAREAALATVVSLASAGTTAADNTSVGYYASLASVAMEPPTSRLSQSSGVSLTDAGTGNTLRYVIERMCNATGAPTATGCVMDGANPLHRITALVQGPRNTSEMVQSTILVSVFSPNCAIMTKGTLNMPGTSIITGSGNCVFSNTSVNVGGNLSNTGGYAAAAGSVGTVSKISGSSLPNQPPLVFPPFNTNDYRPYADYIFRSDGKIWRRSTNSVVATATSSSSKWHGWYRDSTNPVRWIHPDSTVSPAGLYYFEGNVGVGGSVGTSTNPWNVSFIAEGAIQISGQCWFVNYTGNASAPQAVNNIFLMARGDIELNGNSSAPAVQGLIISNEELKFNGNNTIVGNLIALNANNTDPSGLDNLIDINEFSGTTNLTYNPDMANNLWQPVIKRLQWRTVER